MARKRRFNLGTIYRGQEGKGYLNYILEVRSTGTIIKYVANIEPLKLTTKKWEAMHFDSGTEALKAAKDRGYDVG